MFKVNIWFFFDNPFLFKQIFHYLWKEFEFDEAIIIITKYLLMHLIANISSL